MMLQQSPFVRTPITKHTLAAAGDVFKKDVTPQIDSTFVRHNSDGTGNLYQRATPLSGTGMFFSQPMQPNAPPLPTTQIASAVQELCKALGLKDKDLTTVINLIRSRDQELSSIISTAGQKPQYFAQHLSSMPRAHVQFMIEGTRITGQVPWLLSQCVETLNTKLTDEGLFRISGSAQRVKQLKEMVAECGPTVIHSNLLSNSINANDVVALMKDFFDSLPGSVLTAELQNYFWQTLASDLSNEAKSRCIALLTFLLPPINRDTLLYYVQFLHDVGCVPGNRMTHASLATCCASIFPMPITAKMSENDLKYQQSVRLSLLQAFIQRPGILMLGSGFQSTSSAADYRAPSSHAFGSAITSTSASSAARYKFGSFALGRKSPKSDTEQCSSKNADVTDAAAGKTTLPVTQELFPTVRMGEKVFTFDSSPSISPRKHQPLGAKLERLRVEPKLVRSGGRMWTPGKRKTPGMEHLLARRRNSGIFSRFRTSPLLRRESFKGSSSPRLKKKSSFKTTPTKITSSIEHRESLKSSRKASGSKTSLETTTTCSSNSDIASSIDDDDDDVEINDGLLSGNNIQQQRLDFNSTPTPTCTVAENACSLYKSTFIDNINIPTGESSTTAAKTSALEVEEPRYMGSLRHMYSSLKRRFQMFFGSKTNLSTDNNDNAGDVQQHQQQQPYRGGGANSAAPSIGGFAPNTRLMNSGNVLLNNNSNKVGRPNLINFARHPEGIINYHVPHHVAVHHSNIAGRQFNEAPVQHQLMKPSGVDNNRNDDADMSMSSID